MNRLMRGWDRSSQAIINFRNRPRPTTRTFSVRAAGSRGRGKAVYLGAS